MARTGALLWWQTNARAEQESRVQLGEYVTHPIADAWPVMEGKKLEEFVADMKANGQLNAIWRWRKDDSILDGRNRLIGCLELGVKPKFVYYEGDDPLGFIRSQNAHRRHESWSMQCVVAARLATLAPGRPSKRSNAGQLSLAAAAAELGVNRSAVRDTAAMLKTAIPAVVEAFQREELTLEAAGELAKLDPDKQLEQLELQAKEAKEYSERGRERAKKKAKTELESDEKLTPQRQLIRIVESALTKAGATIMLDPKGVHVAFRGDVYLLQLIQQPKKNAA